jgi:hypothetical protein
MYDKPFRSDNELCRSQVHQTRCNAPLPTKASIPQHPRNNPPQLSSQPRRSKPNWTNQRHKNQQNPAADLAGQQAEKSHVCTTRQRGQEEKSRKKTREPRRSAMWLGRVRSDVVTGGHGGAGWNGERRWGQTTARGGLGEETPRELGDKTRTD